MLQILASSDTHPLLPVLMRDLSRPVGALDPARRKAARARFEGYGVFLPWIQIISHTMSLVF
jgi:hypothetical protein